MKNNYSLSYVKEALNLNDLAPLKKFGQNFLVDNNILEKIANTLPPDVSSCIEIGGGLGGLTNKLCIKNKVLVYEIDNGLYDILNSGFAEFEHVKIIHGDALECDFQKDALDFFGTEKVNVCANLPYYITTPLIMKLINCGLEINHMTLMMQKEVALRIAKKDISAISFAVDYFYDAQILFDVSKNCFYPRPDVDSAVVGFTPKEYDAGNARNYLNTVKILFAKKRKTILNNIIGSGVSKDAANEILNRAGLDPGMRAQELSAEQLKVLSRVLFQV